MLNWTEKSDNEFEESSDKSKATNNHSKDISDHINECEAQCEAVIDKTKDLHESKSESHSDINTNHDPELNGNNSDNNMLFQKRNKKKITKKKLFSKTCKFDIKQCMTTKRKEGKCFLDKKVLTIETAMSYSDGTETVKNSQDDSYV